MRRIFDTARFRRLCITGCERSEEALGLRLRSHPGAVHELRIDCLERPPRSFASLLSQPVTTIVTLRPRREGGLYPGSERQRMDVLRRALECRPDFIDIEHSTPDHFKREIYGLARGRTRIILSLHDYHGPGADLERLADAMQREPCHIVKLAVAVEDPADLEPLLGLWRGMKKPLILACMGLGGLLTRVLPERFGSVLTYAPVRRELSTAPGQLALGEIEGMRAGRTSRSRLLGIAGGPGALGSHGLIVYNRIFASRKLNVSYVPFITTSLAASMPVLGLLGFRGLSVTQPHKQAALELCDRISPEAAHAGAVNTLLFRGGRILGFNTDFLAARRILEGIRPRRGRGRPRIAIAGAGGAAGAVAAAASRLGWQGSVYNRTPGRAEALGARFGFAGLPMGALDSAGGDFDVLVNCTSVGMDSTESIVRNPRILRGKTVVDLVSHPSRTRLMGQAERAGAGVVPGTRFWALQGHYQMKILASVTLTLKSIENQLRYSEYPPSKGI